MEPERALADLYWFYRTVDAGGPDGSDLDAEVAARAGEAARWVEDAGIAGDGPPSPGEEVVPQSRPSE